MKTASHHSHAQRAVVELRAEVRELREIVGDLEARLSQIEVEDDQDPWGVWPYSWAISGWNNIRARFHSLQLHVNHRELTRHNTRSRRAATDETRALRLM